MSKNNKSDQPPRPKQGQAGHRIKPIGDGYQPERGKFIPDKTAFQSPEQRKWRKEMITGTEPVLPASTVRSAV